MDEKNRQVKENAFDMGIAGTAGAMDYSAGFGTPASPNISQNPASFVGNKSLGSHSNTAASAPASASYSDSDVNQIYSKEVTPSPDEVLSGLKYELSRMIKKDKGMAKSLVLNNLKQDPHYYGKLGMWNIDDKEMMNVNPPSNEKESQLNERIKILNQMIQSKGKKAETPQAIKDALRDTRDKKNKRYVK